MSPSYLQREQVLFHGVRHVSAVVQNGQTGSREGLLCFYVEVVEIELVAKDWAIVSIFISLNLGYSRSPGYEVIYISV